MKELMDTKRFEPVTENKISAEEILAKVYKALSEKGYNPVNQITGYIMSGDPTYITGYNKARSTISKCERDELLEEILNYYIENHLAGEHAAEKTA